MMGWDPQLLNNISKIFAPSGAISLAMQDKAIKKKIRGLNDTLWQLNADTSLQLWRSMPSTPDANGECLVAVLERDGEKVLAPGDYVYERFKTDGNANIRSLQKQPYKAVIVPHHGDEASALNVVTPAAHAKAFFSAGTHQSWGHPKQVSLNAHLAAAFTNLSDPTQPDIVLVNLL